MQYDSLITVYNSSWIPWPPKFLKFVCVNIHYLCHKGQWVLRNAYCPVSTTVALLRLGPPLTIPWIFM